MKQSSNVNEEKYEEKNEEKEDELALIPADEEIRADSVALQNSILTVREMKDSKGIISPATLKRGFEDVNMNKNVRFSVGSGYSDGSWAKHFDELSPLKDFESFDLENQLPLTHNFLQEHTVMEVPRNFANKKPRLVSDDIAMAVSDY